MEPKRVPINETTMRKAIERAVQYKPLVRPAGERLYKVQSIHHNGHHFVEFFQTAEGRFGTCTCEAGRHGSPCYAMGAALIAHLGIARMRRAVKSKADQVDQARTERHEHKKRGFARFECDGIGRHEVCGRKCRFAQRLGGIDI